MSTCGELVEQQHTLQRDPGQLQYRIPLNLRSTWCVARFKIPLSCMPTGLSSATTQRFALACCIETRCQLVHTTNVIFSSKLTIIIPAVETAVIIFSFQSKVFIPARTKVASSAPSHKLAMTGRVAPCCLVLSAGAQLHGVE